MSELRIGTWNVEYADNPDTNLRRQQVMAECTADIWVLTETSDALRPGSEFTAAHSSPRPAYGRRAAAAGARWVSIWTRLPILSRLRLAHADHERTTAALIATPFGPLVVYGTVMPWGGDKGRMGENKDASAWSEHHRVIPLQIAEWREIRQILPDAALCVAGDYNSDMTDASYYGTKCGVTLLQEGLREVGLYCATQGVCTETGALFYPPIDHIALPEEWSSQTTLASAWEGKVGNPRLSDHSGVVVSISA